MKEKLSRLVSVNGTLPRSVNLERDAGDLRILEAYRLTGKTLEIVDRAAWVLAEGKTGAWSLTGPYGMGKTAFLKFLVDLAGPTESKAGAMALRRLRDRDRKVFAAWNRGATASKARKRGFFRVPVTASFEPVNRTLAQGLERAVVEQFGLFPVGACEGVLARVAAVSRKESPDTRELLELFDEIAGSGGAPE